MSSTPPKSVSTLQREAYENRKYLTDAERAELDALLWSPEKERLRYRHDPCAFAREVLHMDLAPYQEEVLQKLHDHKRVAFVGPHGAGKSGVAAACILWFITVFDECKIPTTASAWRQLINFLWPEIHKWALKADWWRVGIVVRTGKELLARKFTLDEGDNRTAFALSSNDETKIEGAHSSAVLYVFDEAKAIPPSIWDAAEGALGTTEDAYAVALSTPGENVGRFFEIHNERVKYAAWETVRATLEQCVAAKRIMPQWVAQKKLEWGETSVMYKRRALGQFAEDSGDSLIRLDWVEHANTLWTQKQNEYDALVEDGMPPKQADYLVWGYMTDLGIDPARFGDDKTGWAFRYANGIREVDKTHKQDTMETASRAREFMQGNTATARVDVNGLGAGVYDRLYEHWKEQSLRAPHDINMPLMAINVSHGTKAKDRTQQLAFNRLRDYLWWNLRELLEAGEICLPPDPELTKQLIGPKWSLTSSGKILVESKEELKKRLNNASPDMADAVCLAFAPETPPYTPLFGFL